MSCRMVTTHISSPCSDRIVPATPSTGSARPVTGSDSWISPRYRCSPVRVSTFDTNDVRCAPLARTRRCAGSSAVLGTLNSRSAGSFISTMSPSWSVTRIGIGDRVDDQLETVALVADLRLRDAQRPVALLDLLLGARQVGDVAQHRDDVGALPLVLRARAEQLEQQVRSFQRIDQQQLAPRQLGLGDGAGRQRGGEQHVVQRRPRAASLRWRPRARRTASPRGCSR